MFSRSNHTGIIRMTPGTVVYSTAAAVSGVEYTFGIQYNNTVLYDTYDQKEMLK